jgi:hypothetical protein
MFFILHCYNVSRHVLPHPLRIFLLYVLKTWIPSFRPIVQW